MPPARPGPRNLCLLAQSARLLGLLLLLLAAAPQPSNGLAGKPNCPQARRLQMDACAARMSFLGDHSFLVPKNTSAMASFCDQLKESIGCVQGYSRDCLQGFAKQILTGLLKRGKQQYNSICQLDSGRAQFIKKLSCLSDTKIRQFQGSTDASIVRFEFISKQVKPDDRLPGICCSYQIFLVDTGAGLDKLCGKASEASQFIQKMVIGTTAEFFQLVCEGHRTMDECKSSARTSEPLKRMEVLTQQAKAGTLKPSGKSLIPPLLEILDASS